MTRASLRLFSAAIAIAGMLAVSGNASAAYITVNGNLSDWGITLRDNTTANTNDNTADDSTWGNNGPMTFASEASSTNFPPLTYTTAAGFKFNYRFEDQIDTAQASGNVYPNQGGQNYDAEFLGVGRDTNPTRLVIAVSTGQRPDNGFANYSPGDIRITMKNGAVYGIEVGGGSGNGSSFVSDGVVNLGDAGTTYKVDNSSGATTGWVSSSAAETGKQAQSAITGVRLNNWLNPQTNLTLAQSQAATALAGQVWLNPDWILDPIDTSHPQDVHSPVQMLTTSGTYIGSAESFIFTQNTGTTQHAAIELALNLQALGIDYGQINTVEWAMGCGNDLLGSFYVHVGDEANVTVPEPTSMALTGLGGLIGLIGIRRRRSQAKAEA